MKNSRTARRVVLLSAFVISLSALPTIASAADRNHDRLPDRWERHFRLSMKVKQARKDQDHDGLRNLAEFRAGDNPRRADTDRDGTKDGDENAGTITSFEDGVLTINLYNGGSVTGKVTSDTRIRCHKAHESGEDPVSARNQGPGSGGQGGQGSEDPSSNPGPGENSDPGPREHGKQGGCHCSTDELTAGTVVEEAELKPRSGAAIFAEIKLGEAADE